MLHTTFNLLKRAGACGQTPGSCQGYDKLATYLGGTKKYGKNTPMPLTIILDSNGLADTLWCLRAVLPKEERERDKLARLFACDCAERVLPLYEARYPDNKRPRTAIEVARLYAVGKATEEELATAFTRAAYAAAAAATASPAAFAAAATAAPAARAAAYDAVYGAANDAEREWQANHLREMLETN